MRHLLAALLASLLLFAPVAAHDWSKTLKRVRPHVARLEVFKRGSLGQPICTVIIVKNASHGLTAHHCIENSENRDMLLLVNKHVAKIVAEDAKSDLVLLSFAALPGKSPIQFADRVDIGTGAALLGYMNGSEKMSGHFGFVSMPVHAEFDNRMAVDMTMMPSNSGGPLVNEQGHLIGLASFVFGMNNGLNRMGYAITLKDIKRFLKS